MNTRRIIRRKPAPVIRKRKIVRSRPVQIKVGDCIDVMRDMPDESVDSIVTDPPYGLEFMGKEWDSFKDRHGNNLRSNDDSRATKMGRERGGADPYIGSGIRFAAGVPFQQWCEEWAVEALRVLKPGGHLLAFGGTRTYHRMAVAIEDAGFEIRDSIAWMYGQGFPKSHNVGDGWGTALKPSFEPIVVARKPFTGTVANNVLTHGTGALNIDGGRIGVSESDDTHAKNPHTRGGFGHGKAKVYGTATNEQPAYKPVKGRWPANTIVSHLDDCEQIGEVGDVFGGGAAGTSGFADGYAKGDGFAANSTSVAVWNCADGCQVAELDRQSGTTKDGVAGKRSRGFSADGYVGGSEATYTGEAQGFGGGGGASRFFYTPKANKSERVVVDGVSHPTVKPLALMQYLIRLVTPPGGVVLDPFGGSGTTAEAAVREGMRCIIIEREPTYIPLIEARVARARKAVSS